MNRVDALIVEDSALKDDHTRLVYCRQLLSSHLQRCIEATDDAASLQTVEGLQIQDVIAQFLHDTWSAIRVQSSKLLLSLSPFISESTRKELIAALIDASRSAATWQEVHGSILGLTALISTCEYDVLLIISGLCLDFIGHSSIPIQDAARSCLLSVQMHVEDKSALVRSILENIQPLVNESMHGPGSEQCSTLRLDGLMGCLVDSYQQFPQLPLLMSAASGCDAQGDLLLGIMDTTKQCMIHPASTVRQKACQLLVIFLSRTVAANVEGAAEWEQDRVFRVIVHFLVGLLDEAVETGRWPQLETALIISEDLAQILIDGKLDILSHPQSRRGPDGYFDALMVHSFKLFQRISTHAAALLLHRAFEVRRMMIQLLPLLARVHVMLGVGVVAIEEEGLILTQSAAEGGTGRRDQVVSADLMARMILSAEALKQNQLLFEAVAEGSGGTSSSGAYHWSADVRGRLQEADRRSVLLSALRNIASGTHPSRPHLLETMVRSCAVILRDIEGTVDLLLEVMLPTTLRPAATSLHTGTCRDGTAFVSTDFIEWYLLVDCFLYSAGEWDALLGTTMVASERYSALRDRLGLLRVTWMMLVVQIQSISRSSICTPSRSSIKGRSRRATATDCLSAYFSNDLRHSEVKRLVHPIVPSLTLLTSHPTLKHEDDMTNYAAAEIDSEVTSSSPTKKGTASQGVGAYLTTNQISYWRGVDKWTCEAVAPLILPFTRSVVLQGGTGPLSLAAVLVEWLIACLMDPLWLDGRSHSVKNMFEALITLLASSLSPSSCFLGEERWWRHLTAVHIVRAVATGLSLRSIDKPTLDISLRSIDKPILDIRSFTYLIRAASAAIDLAMFLKRDALSAGSSEGVEWDACSCSVFSDAAEMQRLSNESCSILRDAVAYYRPIYVDLDDSRDGPADEDAEFSDWDDEVSEPGDLCSTNRSIYDCIHSGTTTTGSPLAEELDRLLVAVTGFEQQSPLPV